METNPTDIENTVRSRYGEVARLLLDTSVDGQSCCNDSCCDDPSIENTDTAGSCCDDTCCNGQNTHRENDGAETARNPLSLGCDVTLIQTAAPQPGEVVIDLGSGPGYDTRKIAELTGSSGKIYGIDFEAQMVALARQKSADFENITYIQADISNIPLNEGIADLIVSNCVLNLVPDKSAVFAEAYRLLKPGGRVVLSDMIADSANKEISDDDYCACIGGATSKEEYLSLLQNVGFEDISATVEFEDEFRGTFDLIPYQSVLFTAWKNS